MERNAAQHTDLSEAFTQLTRAASALLLDCHLDLASATISLARRVRAAAVPDVFSSDIRINAEAESIVSGAEAIASRIALLPAPDAIRDIADVIVLTTSYRNSLNGKQSALLAA